ncbi:purine and uridine phosphorylase [Penicillium angulare]|uniref:purine and uridine phosphorylase n=1 Tax=Penicillium angulare TaxID=116970 RepID=UPI00253FD1CD|nr:purine and uridine phosphorylase [Penicillium angulare]KAJ5280806.1 purine and uridine phosphorylase [Penicillium angulare]
MSDPQNYQVGWICAIETEYVAAKAFLDEIHKASEYLSPSDNNDYTLGKVGNHNIVIAILPDDEYGTTSAASVARDMLHSFTNIRVGLMVGIAGGAPSATHGIRLGDVVVSAARDGKDGVVQFDFGKRVQCREFQRFGFLNQPSTVLRTAVVGLRSQHTVHGHQLDESVNAILQKNPRLQEKFARPDKKTDILYHSDFLHAQGADNCGNMCGNDPSILKLQSKRSKDDDTVIHYGLIASSNH